MVSFECHASTILSQIILRLVIQVPDEARETAVVDSELDHSGE